MNRNLLPSWLLVLVLLGRGLPLCAISAPALGGDLPLSKIAESSDLRSAAWESFLAAAPVRSLAAQPLLLENAYGKWKRSAIRDGDQVYLLFAAERDGGFPLYAQGSWIIKRSFSQGRFLQAKIFLRSDPGCFLRLYPAGERSRMDLVLYGAVLRREIALPLPFDRLLRTPLADLLKATADSVDWDSLSPRPGLYAELRLFVSEIRERLPGLRYADDGATDAQGHPVLIASGRAQTTPAGLNCSGFAKWVADGIYKPITGTWLDTESLRRREIGLRGSSFTAPYEESHDPFFGLDWTRNIAQALDALRSSSPRSDPKTNDVRFSPFALRVETGADPINGGSGYVAYPAYGKDVGYEMSGLEALLYLLALEDPGSFYFASLSKLDGGLRRHYHVAVLIPYFEASGQFRVAVFESAAETSLAALMRRAPTDFVHLVRARPGAYFDPPVLP